MTTNRDYIRGLLAGVHLGWSAARESVRTAVQPYGPTPSTTAALLALEGHLDD